MRSDEIQSEGYAGRGGRYEQEPFEQDILKRYGDDSPDLIDESKEKMQQWTKEDYLESQARVDQINNQLKGVIEAGLVPSSPQTQQIIGQHYESIGRFYTPSANVYISLGELYVNHLEFKKVFDAYHPELAEYLRDGMKIFADHQL